MKELFGGG